MFNQKLLIGLAVLLLAWWILTNPKRENFHDRGVGPGPLFGCCNGKGLSAVAGYKNIHPLFIESGPYECTSCLYSDPPEWCYTPPQEWADPPPLDYRVPKDVCYC
jgi:hypothetical protein